VSALVGAAGVSVLVVYRGVPSLRTAPIHTLVMLGGYLPLQRLFSGQRRLEAANAGTTEIDWDSLLSRHNGHSQEGSWWPRMAGLGRLPGPQGRPSLADHLPRSPHAASWWEDCH